MTFEQCEFPPDSDPCEKCGRPNLQLYFARTNRETNEGRYYCAECVRKEEEENRKYAEDMTIASICLHLRSFGKHKEADELSMIINELRFKVKDVPKITWEIALDVLTRLQRVYKDLLTDGDIKRFLDKEFSKG